MAGKTQKAVKAYAQDILDSYKTKLKQDNAVYTGGLLETTVEVNRSVTLDDITYSIYFDAEDYLLFVEDGRLSGSWPPVDSIKRWVQEKPVLPQPFILPDGNVKFPNTDQIAYLIGRKIFEDGIPPKPFILESLLDNEYHIDLIKEAIAEDNTTELQNLLDQ